MKVNRDKVKEIKMKIAARSICKGIKLFIVRKTNDKMNFMNKRSRGGRRDGLANKNEMMHFDVDALLKETDLKRSTMTSEDSTEQIKSKQRARTVKPSKSNAVSRLKVSKNDFAKFDFLKNTTKNQIIKRSSQSSIFKKYQQSMLKLIQ